MRAATSVTILAGLVGLGLVLREVLPDSSVVAVRWQAQEYFIPYNIAGFWGCIAGAVAVAVILAVWAMLRDVERLR